MRICVVNISDENYILFVLREQVCLRQNLGDVRRQEVRKGIFDFEVYQLGVVDEVRKVLDGEVVLPPAPGTASKVHLSIVHELGVIICRVAYVATWPVKSVVACIRDRDDAVRIDEGVV